MMEGMLHISWEDFKSEFKEQFTSYGFGGSLSHDERINNWSKTIIDYIFNDNLVGLDDVILLVKLMTDVAYPKSWGLSHHVKDHVDGIENYLKRHGKLVAFSKVSDSIAFDNCISRINNLKNQLDRLTLNIPSQDDLSQNDVSRPDQRFISFFNPNQSSIANTYILPYIKNQFTNAKGNELAALCYALHDFDLIKNPYHHNQTELFNALHEFLGGNNGSRQAFCNGINQYNGSYRDEKIQAIKDSLKKIIPKNGL